MENSRNISGSNLAELRSVTSTVSKIILNFRYFYVRFFVVEMDRFSGMAQNTPSFFLATCPRSP